MLVFVVVLRQCLYQEARQHHATSDQCSKACHLSTASYGSRWLVPRPHALKISFLMFVRASLFFIGKNTSPGRDYRECQDFGADRTAMSFCVIKLGRWVGYLPTYFINMVPCQSQEPQLRSFCNHWLCCGFFVRV